MKNVRQLTLEAPYESYQNNLKKGANLQSLVGAVFQVRKTDETDFRRCFATCGPPSIGLYAHKKDIQRLILSSDGLIKKIGQVSPSHASSSYNLAIYHGMDLVYRSEVIQVRKAQRKFITICLIWTSKIG